MRLSLFNLVKYGLAEKSNASGWTGFSVRRAWL